MSAAILPGDARRSLTQGSVPASLAVLLVCALAGAAVRKPILF